MHQKMFTKTITSLVSRRLPSLSRAMSSLSDYEIQRSYPRMEKTPPLPIAYYGGRHTVTMIPGCGIGPEQIYYVKQVFEYAGVPVDFEIVEMNPNQDDNEDLDYAINTIKRNGVAIKGRLETNSKDDTVRLRNVALRNDLDLYIYFLWCKSYPGVRAKQKDIDIIVIRQNTEGEYSLLEHSIKGMVENLKIITESNSLRVAKYAFEFARKNGRKKVTTVHKANIMKMSDGLFLECCREMSKNYPDIRHNDIIIDNCCMQLVVNPHQFDVIITPNLYGNVVANVICGLAGGPGLFSCRHYGDHYVMFEPGTRNRGKNLAGKNIANPVVMLNAGVDMLYHLGHIDYANKLEKAIWKTLCEDKVHTPDIGGTATSDDVVNSVIRNVFT